MFRTLLVLTALCLVLTACTPGALPPPPPLPVAAVPAQTPTAKPAPIPGATLETQSAAVAAPALAGNLLGDPAVRNVNVLLPPGYAAAPDKRYPVLYVIPWANGEPSDNTAGFQAAVQALLRAGEIPELIVVLPDVTDKLGASLVRSSPTVGDYEGFVTRDLVDYVDGHYRTLAAPGSRAVAGCSNGGHSAMRLGLKYPAVFGAVAASSGGFNDVPWQSDVAEVNNMKSLPVQLGDVDWNNFGPIQYYMQAAAAAAPDPTASPFYLHMPFRIVDGHGEFVPEILAKIEEEDATHEAQRYAAGPDRLHGILIQQGKNDAPELLENVRSFDQLLTELGIAHTYVENDGGHCDYPWEAESLKFVSGVLDF